MSAQHPTGLQARVIAFAIRFRGIVVALACLLVAYGVYALGQAKYDVFPEFAPPQVAIQTEAAGLTPEQVEVLVTRPIETAVNGLPGVQTLRSTSIQGLSIVSVFFGPASDIYRDRQLVAERLASAAQQLPQGVQPPAITPLTSSTSTVLVAGLTSKTRSQMDLRTAAEWTTRLRLLAVPGVADVIVFGGDTRSIQVQVHPDKLVRYGLGLNDVMAAAQQATGVRGAGFVDTKNQRIVFQTEGQSLSADEIARTVVSSQGVGRVTLGSVADVVVAPEPPIGAALVQGKPGVILNISEQYGANTMEVTRGVEAALEELRPALKAQGIELQSNLFRPANFISTALSNIRTSLILGGVLVVVVLFLFLFNLRTAAISCAAIPLSLLAAIIVIQRLGLTLNTMTLGGLAVAVGVVVDDAVIGVENVARRLRENRRSDNPRPEARVVFEAIFEVRGAVVYATLAVILVFLPIIALSGIAGRLFAPMGITYILAVLASLVVALTVTPALAMMWLVGRLREVADPPVVRWSRGHYQRLLDGIVGRPTPVSIAAAAFTVLASAALPFFGAGFIPELKEGHYIIHMSAAPGTSLEESARIGARVADALHRIPEIRSVGQRVGRAELASDTWGTHYSEFEVDLKPLTGEQAEEVQGEVRKALAGFVGVNFSVKTFLTERIEETLSGYTAAVAVNVFGNDLDLLDQKAQVVATVLGGVPGASEVQVQSPPGLPQITIRLRKGDLLRWGLDPVQVLDLVRTAYQGDVVGQTYEGSQVFNVLTILDRDSRGDPARIGQLPLRTPSGVFVQLSQVADVFAAPGRYQVQHEGARRLVTVTANVAGRDVASFVKDAKAAIASGVKLPAGAYVTFAGAAEAQSKSQSDLLLNSLVAGAGIVLLLSVVTRNWRNLLLVLANLPFALAGGVLAVLITGGMLTLGSMVGFVTVFGISLRNSILMISHFEHLVEVEGRTWGPQTAIQGAADRLVPILMTSLVTALGLLPLAIGMGDPGREIEGPMAVVILGGLMTSMALNLLVLPTLALAFGRFEPAVDVLAESAPPAASPQGV
ncbi:efflux RND transporter permease subunit [Phenylobacterium montanum]|uniref:efflux RND transporter permease subunit n=1 Tax=Phenylobacterium montanum TaxID=2823693 RepID=UPI0020132A73|nr:efflux RND transporter permease subunit [Caulobacter sp. S6]